MGNSGFIFLDKEEGSSSRKRDNRIRRKRNAKSVGHLGTLDPFASGLLILAVGEATKRLPYLKDGEKTYVAELTLGKETDSLDYTGKVLCEKEIPAIEEGQIRKALKELEGTYRQEIPSYSAAHINGKRRYDLAREGKDVPVRKKPVTVFERKLLGFKENTISFQAKVSKGTYIRSLGKDLAEKLDTIGYLSSLRRRSVGEYNVSRAKRFDCLEESDLIPMERLFPSIPVYLCSSDIEEHRAKHGNELYLNFKSDLVFVKNKENILALYQKEGGHYVCRKGFNF